MLRNRWQAFCLHDFPLFEKMMRQIFTMGTCFLLASCDSSVTDSKSYASPDGTRIVTVIEELQGANDPAPWWTHVSLRENRDKSAMIPGNLLKLEGRGAVTAAWSGDQEVTIFVDDALFSQVSTGLAEKQGVQIRFRKASTGMATNSETDGGGQPGTRSELK